MNDYATLLSPAERQRLEARLAEGERRTGAQMAIAIFRSLEGESLEDFSIRLAEQWRIGLKGLDNGVILLVFLQDRKLRFEVGYGLEPVVTDAFADRIIREVIAPRFREGRYAAGLEGAAEAVFARIAEPRGAPGRPGSRGEPQAEPIGPLVGFAAILLLVALVLLQEALSARRYVGRNAYTAGRRGWDVPIVMAPPWWGRGGGWGGGFSSGGFAGGGGAFGGGGASGEW